MCLIYPATGERLRFNIKQSKQTKTQDENMYNELIQPLLNLQT